MKPRVLACYDYSRRVWAQQFERIADRLEVIFLSSLEPGPADIKRTDLPAVYWKHFADAAQLLEQVRPDVVVFMDLSGGRVISLNAAARRLGITTVLLEHGIPFNDELSVQLEGAGAPLSAVIGGIARGGQAARWLARGWIDTPIHEKIKFIEFCVLLKRGGALFAMRRVQAEFLRADHYIEMSQSGVEWRQKLNGILPSRAVVIGNPEFDAAFRTTGGPTADCRYYLLIDSALAVDAYPAVPKQEMVDTYLHLADFAVSQGAKLRVKLHPYAYEATWLPEHPGIEWYRATELGPLIRGAIGCFALPSTLTVLAAALRPTCVLLPFGADLASERFAASGIVTLHRMQGFRPTLDCFPTLDPESAAYQQFIRDYHGATDGFANERLGAELLRLASSSLERRSRLEP